MVLGGHAPPSAVVGVTIGLTTLAGLVAIARLITRIFIVRTVGIDDVCITAAVVLTIGITITMNEQVRYGMGQHDYDLNEDDVVMSLKWFWASVWIYYLALCFTKLSILIQYLRVFPHNKFRVACYILIGVVAIYSCCTFFTAMFACTPIAYFWDWSLNGTCLDQTAIWFTNASINIVTDIMTAILPLPVLNTLRISKRQKALLMSVFCLGGFTCIISILRLNALYIVSHTKDISWNNPLAAIWSSTEVNVGILCSCLPTLKGLIGRLLPQFFGTDGSVSSSFRLRRGVKIPPSPDGDQSQLRTMDTHGDDAEPGQRDLSMKAFLQTTEAILPNNYADSYRSSLPDAGRVEAGLQLPRRNFELPRRDSEILNHENPSMTGLSPTISPPLPQTYARSTYYPPIEKY